MKRDRDIEIKNTVTEVEDIKDEQQAKVINVTVTVNNLAKRKGPGFDFDTIGIADAGRTKIVEEYTDDKSEKWGKLEDGGWINLKWTREVH